MSNPTELFVNHYLPEEQDWINSDQDDDKERKYLKYHYTNLESLKKILGSKNLWLMHYEYLNDSTEGTLVFEHLKEQLKEKDYIEKLKKLYRTMIKNF
jgi:hypothetical protein